MRPAHVANRHHAPRRLIDPQRTGEILSGIIGTDIKHIPRSRVSFEINQVQGALGVKSALRLNAAIGNTQKCDFRLGP